jgi:hypothetical protein
VRALALTDAIAERSFPQADALFNFRNPANKLAEGVIDLHGLQASATHPICAWFDGRLSSLSRRPYSFPS